MSNYAGLKALLTLHLPEGANGQFGGPFRRVAKTVEALQNRGVAADIGYGDSAPNDDYDIVHIHNIWTPQEALQQVKYYRPKCRKLVFSPIYLDQSFFFMSLGLAEMFAGALSLQDAEALFAPMVDHLRPLHPTAKDNLALIAPDYMDCLAEIFDLIDHVVYLSEYERSALISLYPSAQALSSSIVRNASSITFRDGDGGEMFRQRYNLDRYILCVGSIERRKNQLALATAWQHEDIPLVMIGAGSDAPYKETTQRLMPSAWLCTGRISDDALLASAYAGADAFVLPSFAEGAPLVALEAGAVGTPLVLSNRSAEREYFGDWAEYLDPTNVSSIRSAVNSALNKAGDRLYRQQLSEFVQTQYSYDRVGEALDALYTQLLQEVQHEEQKHINSSLACFGDGAEQVKILIWDLDETFWDGTLAEGSCRFNETHWQMVCDLQRRGIVNSICSYNAFDSVCAEMQRQGTWDAFVFPEIGYVPKGVMIKTLLQRAGLRAANAVFVDDNLRNLQEAEFENPGLRTVLPQYLSDSLSCSAFQGKDDPHLSRHRSYKDLEAREKVKKQYGGDNLTFLRSLDVQVCLVSDLSAHLDRLDELINRTNQLNYTKMRINKAEIQALLDDPAVSCGAIAVRDRVGDYGIVGFYAVRENIAEHFVFSCRILNMGVESWLWSHLGRPQVNTVGEVAVSLDQECVPDWIRTVVSQGVEDAVPEEQQACLRLFLKGGCDLTQMLPYLEQDFTVFGEYTTVGRSGIPLHSEHSELILQTAENVLNKYAYEVQRIPFLEETSFSTQFFTEECDVHILSVVMDYTQGLYRYRDTDWIVPFGNLDWDITNPKWWEHQSERVPGLASDGLFLPWFRDNFTFLGGISEDRFGANLERIWSNLLRWQKVPRLVVLNGAETNLSTAQEHLRHERHARLNAIVERFVAKYQGQGVYCCDVRQCIFGEADHGNGIRHFGRHVYASIAEQLRGIILSA